MRGVICGQRILRHFVRVFAGGDALGSPCDWQWDSCGAEPHHGDHVGSDRNICGYLDFCACVCVRGTVYRYGDSFSAVPVRAGAFAERVMHEQSIEVGLVTRVVKSGCIQALIRGGSVAGPGLVKDRTLHM